MGIPISRLPPDSASLSSRLSTNLEAQAKGPTFLILEETAKGTKPICLGAGNSQGPGKTLKWDHCPSESPNVACCLWPSKGLKRNKSPERPGSSCCLWANTLKRLLGIRITCPEGRSRGFANSVDNGAKEDCNLPNQLGMFALRSFGSPKHLRQKQL